MLARLMFVCWYYHLPRTSPTKAHTHKLERACTLFLSSLGSEDPTLLPDQLGVVQCTKRERMRERKKERTRKDTRFLKWQGHFSPQKILQAAQRPIQTVLDDSEITGRPLPPPGEVLLVTIPPFTPLPSPVGARSSRAGAVSSSSASSPSSSAVL